MTTNRSPATHLGYKDRQRGDIILIDVLVPEEGSQEDTYYCCLHFNPARDGGGYCGIQNHGRDRRTYIFSLWNPRTPTDEKITAEYQSPGTASHYFGHEGTGLHSNNKALGWDPDHWYTLVVRTWDVGQHTHFGFWVHNQSGEVWTHLITMDYPIGGLHLSSATNSFMENFSPGGDGSLNREVHYGHGYKRLLDKTWRPFDKALFRVNQGRATANWNSNYNAGTKEDYFFLKTGETVHPDTGIGIRHNFHLSTVMPAKPTKPAITFSINQATHDMVEWSVPESSTPQFGYTIDVDGKEVTSGIDPLKRNFNVSDVEGQEVTVTLEDLLGEKTTMSKVRI